MMWDLPIAVDIDGIEFKIRNKCDYRVVLDVIAVLNDEELSKEEKIKCSLFIFYENCNQLTDIETATKEMFKIINNGEEEDESQPSKPRVMDWQHDFMQLAPPISRTLGYSVRDSANYTHWMDFIGAFNEIGEGCTFSKILTIRNKKMKGKKLEVWEQEFYKSNKKMVDLPQNLTESEKEWLDSDW